jgi:NADPH:quinone reductase-like Zn-dependent oxidoreductase
MKGWTLAGEGTGLEKLKLRTDLKDPSPSHGQVLVRVHAASLNFRDLVVLGGMYVPSKPNLIPLSDGAGEVAAVGEGVTRFKKGDRVSLTFHTDWFGGKYYPTMNRAGRGGGQTDGMLTQYTCVSQEEVVHLPQHLSYEEGATLPCAAVTAWCALTAYTPLSAGDTVLVQGSGGVSVFALQFAKLFGARVIATSSSDAKLKRLKELGADQLINYKQVPDWHLRVLELTGGFGVDYAIEVGGKDTLAKTTMATRVAGQVNVIGLLSGMPEVGQDVLLRTLSIHGSSIGSREHFEQMNRAIAMHRLKPVVDDKVFGFNEAVQAVEYLQSQRHFGKVVIRID